MAVIGQGHCITRVVDGNLGSRCINNFYGSSAFKGIMGIFPDCCGNCGTLDTVNCLTLDL